MRKCLGAVLGICCALLLWGCGATPAAPTPAPDMTTAPEAEPIPSPTLDAQAGLIYVLAASTWQDIYDENFYLTFDILSGTMVEENRALGTRSVYRISVENGTPTVWAENGGVRQELALALNGDVLEIDYGEQLGVITYKKNG